MSKKNLARTAIEGGRAGRWQERFATRAERKQARTKLHKIKADPEYADEFTIEPRDYDGRDFADKLSPVFRWLEAQCGRLWDDVYSEIRTKFPGRSLAGRHIIGHINGYISRETDDHARYNYYGLVIGADGILRNLGSWKSRNRPNRYDADRERILAMVHWILDCGLHAALNHAMKHSAPSSLEPTFVRSHPRLLMGKHDADQFLQDILAGMRKGQKDYHAEWREALFGFIQKVRPDFDFGEYNVKKYYSWRHSRLFG